MPESDHRRRSTRTSKVDAEYSRRQEGRQLGGKKPKVTSSSKVDVTEMRWLFLSLSLFPHLFSCLTGQFVTAFLFRISLSVQHARNPTVT